MRIGSNNYMADDSLEAIANQLASEMPTPQPHAISEAMANDPTINTQGESNAELDALGVPWNSDIHATGSDGKGIRTKSGAWRNRRGTKGTTSILRRGPNPTGGNDGGTGSDTDQAAQRAAEQSAANLAACQATGKMLAGMFMTACVVVGGDEWKPGPSPLGIGREDEILIQSFTDYAVATNMTQLTPGWALVMSCSMYAVPRFVKPESQTRKRIGGIFGWIRNKYIDWRAARLKRKGIAVESKKPVKENEQPKPATDE